MAIRPDNHIRTGIGIGNPGARQVIDALDNGTINADYSIENKGAQDAINMTDILTDNIDDGLLPDDAKDFIKFKIHVIDPTNPTNSDLIVFRAFLDDFNDDFRATYNNYQYNGRAESFYTYGGFERTLNFSFKLVAQTRQEMKPLYRKLNYLAAQTTPEYSANGRIRAKFNRLTIGDWCNETPGFFNTVGLRWSNKYPWEISAENNTASNVGKDGIQMNQLPQMLDVQCQYTIIHDFAPQNNKNMPYILPHRGITEGQRWIEAGEVKKTDSTPAPAPISPLQPSQLDTGFNRGNVGGLHGGQLPNLIT
jgi:hypothetical protein